MGPRAEQHFAEKEVGGWGGEWDVERGLQGKLDLWVSVVPRRGHNARRVTPWKAGLCRTEASPARAKQRNPWLVVRLPELYRLGKLCDVLRRPAALAFDQWNHA